MNSIDEVAEKFLYVPTNGRKIPLRDWKWVDNFDGDNPRSEANPWVFTYEETQRDELTDRIRERYDEWDGGWIRVGSVDGFKWYNVDIDLDEDEHEAVLQNPEAIGFDDDLLTVIKTRGGFHLDFLTTEDVETLQGARIEGIDYQGDTRFAKGVAGDPFHGSDDYEVKNVGRVIESEGELVTGKGLTYMDDPLFSVMPEQDELTHEETLEVSSDHPVDMFDFFPEKDVKERFAHPVHGSSTNSNTFIDDSGLGHCFRHNTTFNAYHLIGMEAGVLECGEWEEHDVGYAGKRDEIQQACEERDIPVPRYWLDGNWHAEFSPVDGMGSGDMSIVWDIRRELRAKAFAAADEELNGHLVGPKGSGKTHSIVSLAARDDTQVFAAAPHTDKYDEILQEAEDRGVSALILPSFPRHSDLYDDWKEHYHMGAYPREIYGWEDRDVGTDEYRQRSDAEWEDFDLLIGAPQHMFLESAVKDRMVIADDTNLGTFRHVVGDADKQSVNTLLEQCSDEYESYQQLEREGSWSTLRNEVVRTLSREDRFEGISTIEEALQIVQDDELDRRMVIEGLGLNLETLDLARVMCGETNRGEEYMRYKYEGEIRRIYKRVPIMSEAKTVWTSSATFQRQELEELFALMQVDFDGVFGSARHGDMERGLDRWAIQTSGAQHVKSNPKKHHQPERIESIARGIERLGEEFGLDEETAIFSTLAETRHIDGAENYGSLTGTNRHSKRHLAVAGGAQHFGDHHVRDVAVSTGAAPDTPDRGEGFKPAEWSDETHADVDKQMRWSGLYEAATRVGRGDSETTLVAIDSAAIPPWMQTIDQSDRVKQLSGAERAVLDAVNHSDAPLQVKQHDGEGLEDVLDFSAVRLYEAVEELLDAGWLEVAGEGSYNAKQYSATEDAPVNSDIKGIQKAELTGSSVSHAENPEWDMVELELGESAKTDARQMELSEIMPPG